MVHRQVGTEAQEILAVKVFRGRPVFPDTVDGCLFADPVPGFKGLLFLRIVSFAMQERCHLFPAQQDDDTSVCEEIDEGIFLLSFTEKEVAEVRLIEDRIEFDDDLFVLKEREIEIALAVSLQEVSDGVRGESALFEFDRIGVLYIIEDLRKPLIVQGERIDGRRCQVGREDAVIDIVAEVVEGFFRYGILIDEIVSAAEGGKRTVAFFDPFSFDSCQQFFHGIDRHFTIGAELDVLVLREMFADLGDAFIVAEPGRMDLADHDEEDPEGIRTFFFHPFQRDPDLLEDFIPAQGRRGQDPYDDIRFLKRSFDVAGPFIPKRKVLRVDPDIATVSGQIAGDPVCARSVLMRVTDKYFFSHDVSPCDR